MLIGVAGEGIDIFVKFRFKHRSIKFDRLLENIGAICWIVLVIGLVMEMSEAAKSDNKVVELTQRIAQASNNVVKIDPLNQPISEMSATIIFFVKEKEFNELTNWDKDAFNKIGTLYLMNNKSDLGTPFDPMYADNFSRHGGFIMGEPNARDNRRYDLRFHSEIWGAFMGVERPVKSIADLHWIRLDVNFVPNGAHISGGGVDLVVNNEHKLFRIFPQSDTNMPDGTIQNGAQIFPYRIFATNVDDAPVAPAK